MKSDFLLVFITWIQATLLVGCTPQVDKTEICLQQCGIPLYTDTFKNTHFRNAFFDYEQSLCCAKQLNKPLLVYFNSWACVNCRKIEETILSNDTTISYLQEHYVIANLYVDERAIAVEKERVIASYRGEKFTRIGELNNALQIEKCQTGSQPCFIVLDKNGNSLADYMSYTTDAQEFYNWLKLGVEQFAR